MDVKDIIESDDTIEVITTPEIFHDVLLNLEKKYTPPKFSTIEWRPQNIIEVNDEDQAKALLTLLDKLEDLDDVQSVISNFNIEDKLMEKLI